MIYSMTAYARQEIQTNDVAIYWDIRSVNHKYLDLTFKIPEELRNIEHLFRDIIKKNISRGKLDCHLQINIINQDARELAIDENIAKQVITACQKISFSMQSPAVISPLDILNWPGVIKRDCINWENIQELTKTSLQNAIEVLNINKKQEGQALLDIIRERICEMEIQLRLINDLLPNAVHAHREKLVSRLQELSIPYDAGRLEQEMLYLIQKSDIAEELDRLNIHINETNRILNQGGMIGRRLDFMMQEINREANTLAAKAIEPKISLAAVELKVLIEQIREQSQNLE